MEIRSATYVISSPDIQSCPAADLPEYAFIGRSNVGKSSLINMLVDIDKLAKTSSAPGKTQLINHFAIESISASREVSTWWLVDLPGYGFATQKLDLDFVNSLGKWEIPFSLVFTKSDKENQKTVQANVKAFLNKMLESWQFLPQHFITSATKKTGREPLLRLIESMNAELKEARKT